jgi:hypothetical protein
MSSKTRRRSYARIYVPISGDKLAVATEPDGRMKAFTHYDDARDLTMKRQGFIVTGFSFFRDRLLDGLTVRPAAMRVYVRGYGGVMATYHAQMDATPEELGTLNEVMPSDELLHPRRVLAIRSRARVWKEPKS